MTSYIKNREFTKIIVFSILITVFVKYFYFIPSISLFILLITILILNFHNSYFSRIFVFLSLSIAIMTFIPNICLAFIKPYFNNIYIHIISSLFLICLISFTGGSCLAQKEENNPYFSNLLLLSLVLVCFFGCYLFKDILIYEEIFAAVLLFLIAVIFMHLGANYRHKYLITKFHNISFLLCILIAFVSSNYIIKKPISKVGLIECFNQWANTKNSYTVNDMTLKSGYSYSLMKEVLQNKYQLVSVNDSNDRSELKKILPVLDVAIIITPTIPLEVQESKTLKEFVINGGRLVVIADHTDLYGHGKVINSFLKETGVSIEYNALFNAKDYYAKVQLPSMQMYSVRPKTPCSLNITSLGYVWGWASNWISESADYTRPNFFGEFSWTADDLVGNWPTGGIVKYGKGEIVVWCDSTMFANFCIFQPDTLRLLGILIESGEILGILSPYGVWLLIFTIFLILFEKLYKKLFQINIITYCSLGLVIFSGTFYLWDFNPETFYLKDKRIDVYGLKNLFDEPPPKSILKEDNLSSAYSHIARYGLYPLYMGKKPKKPVINKSIWVTSLDKALSIDSKIYKSLWGIIIINLDKKMKNIGFNEISMDDNISNIFKELFEPKSQSRRMLVTDNSTHTLIYNGVSIFAAHGVITDRYLGDWWITTNVSPYRQYILREWYDWLINKKDISKFIYPSVGIESGMNDWFIKVEKKNFTKKKMSVQPYEKNQNYVYIGSGIWALYEKNIDGEFLLGGTETSDDYLKSGNIRWAAHASTEK